MKAEQLLREGRLEEAISSVSAFLRDNPTDVRSRTFLFELLCFSGDYDRAEKHLALLGDSGKDSAVAALLYQGALNAERTRREMFDSGEYPRAVSQDPATFHGTLNGRTFTSLADADSRLGTRLEVIAAGDYLWIPFQHIASVEIGAPQRLRDLLWIPARVRTSAEFTQRELGEVLLPALCPLSFQHPDDAVRLGRVTEWCADDAGAEAPYGSKTLIVDGESISLLEVRQLEFAAAA